MCACGDAQCALGGDHRERGIACNRARMPHGDVEKLVGLAQFRNETCRERPRGIDRLAGQDHLRRQRGADHRGQPLRAAAAGQAADADLGQGEARANGRDPQVAGECKLEPTAEGQAVDGGNYRLAELVERLDDPRTLRIGGGRGAEVAARTECAAGACKHHHAHGRIGIESGEGRGQCRAHLVIDGVAFVRAVERDKRHRVLDVNGDRAQ